MRVLAYKKYLRSKRDYNAHDLTRVKPACLPKWEQYVVPSTSVSPDDNIAHNAEYQ